MAEATTLIDLPTVVRQKFNAAKASAELTFWPTEVAVLSVHGIPFQLRYSTALSRKPRPLDHKGGDRAVDPFLNPKGPLFITNLGSPPGHNLVLNKFAIIPEHFILATKEYKEQSHLLEEDDLGAAFACLDSWAATGKELFAFFNSGPHSGASQPHRHIQFLPVESMMMGLESEEWYPLVDRLTKSPKLNLPFTYFAVSLPSNPTETELHALYISLHDQACRAITSYLSGSLNNQAKPYFSGAGPSPISYNLGLTTKSMVLIPRRAEGASLTMGDEGANVGGSIALNGTILAGTLLVKNEEEWSTLRGNGSKLLEVLQAIGIPSDAFQVGKP